MSLPITTPTPSSQSLTPHSPEIITNGRDALCSSYSDEAEENFILKLRSKHTPNDHIFLGKPKSKDKEIDIFDAEKYFNAPNHNPKVVVNKPSMHNRPMKDETLKIFAITEQPIDTATTLSMIHSEPSRWNSRTALLHTVPRNQQPPRKVNKKSFFAAMIGCNSCSCTNQNSVNITGENKSNKGNKGDHLVEKSRPRYASVKFNEPEPEGNRTAKMKNQVEENITTKRSKSLQVLGSPLRENENMCSDMEHRLKMMTWDRIVVPGILGEDIKIPSISSEMQNETESDASSDLFEIEGFPKVNDNHFVSRQTSDDGCRSPTTCYAPSEESMEWSVVTASVADCSVLSDCEELGSNPNPCTKKTGISSISGPFKEIPRLGSGILSGCKSKKAVRIAGDARR
ncbi:hypothetical protein OROGR_003530 [Orobanche gracilis]